MILPLHYWDFTVPRGAKSCNLWLYKTAWFLKLSTMVSQIAGEHGKLYNYGRQVYSVQCTVSSLSKMNEGKVWWKWRKIMTGKKMWVMINKLINKCTSKNREQRMNNRIAGAFDEMKYVKVAACYALYGSLWWPVRFHHPSWGSPCRSTAGHMTNFPDPDYNKTMLKDLNRIRLLLRSNFPGSPVVDGMELMCCPGLNLEKAETAARVAWISDPVHPYGHLCEDGTKPDRSHGTNREGGSLLGKEAKTQRLWFRRHQRRRKSGKGARTSMVRPAQGRPSPAPTTTQ